MRRIPEPELMLDEAQARAYANADFSEPHDHFIRLLQHRLPELPKVGRAIDLGCGPGDISFRFGLAHPEWTIDAVDASPAMLEIGRARARDAHPRARIEFYEELLPVNQLPHDSYDLLFSNSLLHHLPNAAILWSTIQRFAAAPTRVFVMDLIRPESRDEAKALVDRYAEGEPEVLRRDFYHSLLAAYRPDEIKEQLNLAGLAPLDVEQVSDRHVIVWR